MSYGVTVYGVQCKVPGVTMSGVSFVDTVKHFMNQCVHIQHLNVIEYYVQVLHAFREDECTDITCISTNYLLSI